MRSFKEYNPVTVAFYYITVAVFSMFTMNPVLHLMTFLGGIIQFSVIKAEKKKETHMFFVGLGIILALVRPIFNHNGVTVLFVLNDNPITAEAFIYGVSAAVMVVGVLYLFRVFSVIMTGDRLLYMFARLSPKTALVMSMGLRYIPLLRRKSREIKDAQTAIGINRDDNPIDRIKAALNVFSATVSWGLENGIITADSMASRGYGSHKRSCFKAYRFLGSDIIIIILIVMLGVLPAVASASGSFATVCYPRFSMRSHSVLTVAGYISFGMLMLIPVITDLIADIRWRRLISKVPVAYRS